MKVNQKVTKKKQLTNQQNKVSLSNIFDFPNYNKKIFLLKVQNFFTY